MKVIKTLIAGLALLGLSAPAALAAGGTKPLSEGETPLPEWSFEGPFGKYDKDAVQRGFQVYSQVCASCHGLEHMSYRNLGEPGGPFYNADDPELTDRAVKEFAASKEVTDIDDTGSEYTRPARPSDPFVYPFANKKQAAYLNGAAPPDLSVMVKARHDGHNYIYRLLTGYPEFDENNELHYDDDHSHGVLTQGSGTYYNPYFPGDTIDNWSGDPRHKPAGGDLSMAPPLLFDGQVEYMDGTEATVDQMAEDVAHFLAWAAEPKMENRKSTGLGVMLFLFALAILVYFSYKAIWRNVDH